MESFASTGGELGFAGAGKIPRYLDFDLTLKGNEIKQNNLMQISSELVEVYLLYCVDLMSLAPADCRPFAQDGIVLFDR